MKKKIIFTIMTLGLVTLLGFGFLGGINYQPKEAKASEITAPIKKRVINATNIESIIGSNKFYYARLKNYNNPSGFLYNDSITLANSMDMGSNEYIALSLTADIVRENTLIASSFTINTGDVEGRHHLRQVFLSDNDTHTNYFIYEANQGVYNRQNSAFVFTNAQFAFEPSWSKHLAFFPVLFDIYEIQEDFYEFGDFNPYTYWNVQANTPYVNFTTFDGSILGLVHKDINIVPFYVGGLAFDTIRLYYIGVNAGDHFSVNGQQFVYEGNANLYMTFSHATYYNKATQYELKFYQQEVTYGAYGYNGVTYLCSFNYTNLKIKTIQFFDTPTSIMINDLDNLSNLNQNVGYHSISDVGLGNAFALISQAFTSWIPILSISVIPGITLGMLIFLPLIAGIIIFIIWIVKR